MSALTGNQIKNTYQGLLKLANSSSGITSSYQAIEDGLGNNTGLRISTGILEGKGLPTFVPMKGAYYVGFGNQAPAGFPSGSQNIIMSTPFYDIGQYAYSAVSINVVSATSTSDTVEFAIYTSQMINPFGLYPHTPIVSGITADTTSIGVKTFVFPTNISMSGYGAGVYWIVFKISNSNVTPTVRFGQNAGTAQVNTLGYFIYGCAQLLTPNSYQQSFMRGNNAANSLQVFTGSTTFDNPYSSTLNTTQSSVTNFAGLAPGILLHTA